jgi:uncharacterized membrane protein YhhN
VTAGFFVAAALFAALDWIALARRNKPLEYVCKPAVMVWLVGAALSLDVAGAQPWWWVAALCFSLAGDVFLMLRRNLFLYGLVAFLVAHLAYLGGFWCCERPEPGPLLGAAAGVAVVAAVLLPRILKGAGGLAAPVVVYVAVIAAMAATAVGTLDVWAGAGAVLFFASDALIAWTRFVRPLAWGPPAIIVTYHVGQAALVWSLAY